MIQIKLGLVSSTSRLILKSSEFHAASHYNFPNTRKYNNICKSSSLAKQNLLKHSLLQKILPDLIRFSLLCILSQSKVVSLVSNIQPGGQGPCIYVPPSDRLAQLYPQALDSLFIDFYDLQDNISIITTPHTQSIPN
jgi:hypothetical protein